MTFKSLLLIWRCEHLKAYFHVGNLTYDGSKYIFEYTHHSNAPRKVREAIKNGYRLHPAFPELEKKYESKTLFPAFNRRIPSKDRIDYYKILQSLKLPKDADRMDILRKTRGIIQGDPYFFFEPLRFEEKSNLLSTSFYISGMRYRDLPSDWSEKIHLGDRLYPIHRPVDIDPYAIELHTDDQMFLGYVPAVYSQAMYSLLERNIELNFIVEELHPDYAPQWWVRVSFEATLDLKNDQTFQAEKLNDLVFYVA